MISLLFLIPSYFWNFNPCLLSHCSFGKTNTKYNLTRYLTWMIPNDLYIRKLTCAFPTEREVLSCFIRKSSIFKYVSTCQTHFYGFWIINTMCAFVCLFFVYFSFVPVLSTSIHHYVNFFDIQVLMMVTETKTLTSNIYHNIFTYLDYVFSATFIYEVQR